MNQHLILRFVHGLFYSNPQTLRKHEGKVVKQVKVANQTNVGAEAEQLQYVIELSVVFNTAVFMLAYRFKDSKNKFEAKVH